MRRSIIYYHSILVLVTSNHRVSPRVVVVTILILIILFSSLLVIILKLVSSIVGERASLIREELSAYECGFEHHNVSRVPFSLRYFILTLLFLLFDLEIVYLLFSPLLILSNSGVSLIVCSLFIIFLYLTLFYE